MESSAVPNHIRVGTWNAEGRADPGAVALLLGLKADVLLLTEVHPALSLPGYRMTEPAEDRRTGLAVPMVPGGQHYAAVAAREEMEMEQLSAPAVTSAAARVGGMTFVSTVLPWTCAPSPPYVGRTQSEQVEQAVIELLPWLADQGELVWGGDWNHPLRPPLAGFTVRGRDCLVRATSKLRLTVHTEAELAQPTRNGRCHAIDHIASRHPKRPVEVVSGAPYSTHDVYVVDLPAPAFTGP
jgi:hypothetical protein